MAAERFAVLLALARRSFTYEELCSTLRMDPSRFKRLFDRLWKGGLVSANECEPDGVQSLHLTEEGEGILMREMERMCELPEG